MATLQIINVMNAKQDSNSLILWNPLQLEILALLKIRFQIVPLITPATNASNVNKILLLLVGMLLANRVRLVTVL
jgi:hypothetical protein